MRALATDLAHLLWSVPLYAVLALAWLGLCAYRSRAPGSRLRRWRHGIAALGIVAYCAFIPATANRLRAQIEQQWPVPPLAAVRAAGGTGGPQMLVLAAGWFRKTEGGYAVVLGERSWERTVSAIELHRQVGGTLIFSGAPLPDGSDSVAQHMARAAQRMGVPADHIRTETRSLNTHENMLYSAQQFGLRNRGAVVLITSAVHMPRAVAAAHSVGLQVLPYPCDFRADNDLSWQHFLPSNESPIALEEVLHELLGLAIYRMRGWA